MNVSSTHYHHILFLVVDKTNYPSIPSCSEFHYIHYEYYLYESRRGFDLCHKSTSFYEQVSSSQTITGYYLFFVGFGRSSSTFVGTRSLGDIRYRINDNRNKDIAH